MTMTVTTFTFFDAQSRVMAQTDAEVPAEYVEDYAVAFARILPRCIRVGWTHGGKYRTVAWTVAGVPCEPHEDQEDLPFG